MSGEMIAIITAAIALAAMLVPGQRGMRKDIQHLSMRIGRLEGRADTVDRRFDAVEREVFGLRTEAARVEARLAGCIGKLEAELKARLARLEGYFEAMAVGERPIRKRTAN